MDVAKVINWASYHTLGDLVEDWVEASQCQNIDVKVIFLFSSTNISKVLVETVEEVYVVHVDSEGYQVKHMNNESTYMVNVSHLIPFELKVVLDWTNCENGHLFRFRENLRQIYLTFFKIWRSAAFFAIMLANLWETV